MAFTDIIITDPEILGWKPIIKGTRIGVELLLDKIAMGRDVAKILYEYPILTRDKVYAAFSYL